MLSRSSRLVLLVSMSSFSRAVPQAAHFGEGSPGEMAFNRRFALGLVTCFKMKVACIKQRCHHPPSPLPTPMQSSKHKSSETWDNTYGTEAVYIPGAVPM